MPNPRPKNQANRSGCLSRITILSLLTLVIASLMGRNHAHAADSTPTATPTQEVSMKFPAVDGSNLSRKKYNLPQDFEGKYNLVILVYLQYQQFNVDTWGSLLAKLAAQYPDFRYYELPTLPDYGPLQQSFIDNGMRGGIRDVKVRDRTITLYLDVVKFNAALGIPTTRDIYPLLVDQHGEILWRTNGDYTAEKGEALSQKLAELFADQSIADKR